MLDNIKKDFTEMLDESFDIGTIMNCITEDEKRGFLEHVNDMRKLMEDNVPEEMLSCIGGDEDWLVYSVKRKLDASEKALSDALIEWLTNKMMYELIVKEN